MEKNEKKFSVISIISFAVSLLAFGLYAILLNETNVYAIWLITSVIALPLPLLAKYIRKKQDARGKGFEVAALVFGSLDFYFVIFAATKLNIYIAFGLIAIVCVLYSKLFND